MSDEWVKLRFYVSSSPPPSLLLSIDPDLGQGWMVLSRASTVSEVLRGGLFVSGCGL